MKINFSDKFTGIQSFNFVQPQFTALPSEVKEVLDATITSYKPADDYVVASIQKDLDEFVSNAAGYNKNNSHPSWSTFLASQTILCIKAIENIETKELFERVIDVVDRHDKFNETVSFMKKYVYNALIQKASQLYQPPYERE